jgi:hypothetical protein
MRWDDADASIQTFREIMVAQLTTFFDSIDDNLLLCVALNPALDHAALLGNISSGRWLQRMNAVYRDAGVAAARHLNELAASRAGASAPANTSPSRAQRPRISASASGAAAVDRESGVLGRASFFNKKAPAASAVTPLMPELDFNAEAAIFAKLSTADLQPYMDASSNLRLLDFYAAHATKLPVHDLMQRRANGALPSSANIERVNSYAGLVGSHAFALAFALAFIWAMQ